MARVSSGSTHHQHSSQYNLGEAASPLSLDTLAKVKASILPHIYGKSGV
jgi:hypothetical protein